MLYVVATPIGNLEDITLRALKALQSVDVVLVEDTRTVKKIGMRHGFSMKNLSSLTEHNYDRVIDWIIGLLKNGKEIALVSESGTPTVSDPGSRLVAKCHEEGIRVIPIPGASAVVAAVSASGFSANAFHFEGFLPRKQGKRKKILEKLKSEENTLVFFESPYRIVETLRDMLEVLGDRRAIVCREMTKMYEDIVPLTLSKLADKISKQEPRGEFTIVVEGK